VSSRSKWACSVASILFLGSSDFKPLTALFPSILGPFSATIYLFSSSGNEAPASFLGVSKTIFVAGATTAPRALFSSAAIISNS